MIDFLKKLIKISFLTYLLLYRFVILITSGFKNAFPCVFVIKTRGKIGMGM